MKSKLGLEMRPADTLEMQLLCNCCDQPYHPDKSWEDRIQAIVFGAEQYAICPLCTQAVPEQVLADEGYRQRCRDTAWIPPDKPYNSNQLTPNKLRVRRCFPQLILAAFVAGSRT